MVYRWMDRFDEEGPLGSCDREREGRPKNNTGKVEEETEALLEGNPTEEGDNATRPVTDRIAEHLEKSSMSTFALWRPGLDGLVVEVEPTVRHAGPAARRKDEDRIGLGGAPSKPLGTARRAEADGSSEQAQAGCGR